MCTAITLLTKDHYFGRTLDLDYSYEETVTITPRNYPLIFRKVKSMPNHHAMIGMAYIYENYPLYYEATNEVGLSMAGLNFPKSANYQEEVTGFYNIAPFELIPWILGQCSTVKEAQLLLEKTNILKENYNKQLPLATLHWIISDKTHSITVEPIRENLKIDLNPMGILTNNPTFPMQLFHLNRYQNLTPKTPKNQFSKQLHLEIDSQGMGAIGLPGDWSSPSRFVRASFLKLNSVCGSTETESITQFFHILDSVQHPRGCVVTENNDYEITLYSSCCNTDKGIYYYKTYENSQINAITMHKTNLNSQQLISYPLIKKQQINWQN